MKKNSLNFIDLFAGAGGLSEGFVQEGFSPIAHVEMNKYAAMTLETRAAYFYLKNNVKDLSLYYKYELDNITREEFFKNIPNDVIKTVINKEMTDSTLQTIFQTIDKIMKEDNLKTVDVIIGGPPCQAYSLVGRAQSSHMSIPMDRDPRNELYKMYTQFLMHYKPKIFVFENVVGILTARNGNEFNNLKCELKRAGYEIEYHIQNAKDFGVLQNRKRMIIIGWLKNTEFHYPKFIHKESKAYVNDLLIDLPPVKRGESNNNYKDYKNASRYVKMNKIRKRDDVLTHHVCRKNCENDVEIYKRAIQAWNDGHKRLKYDELPERLKTHKNTTSFIDRFKVVEGDLHYCHTVLAHLSKDGHYFIHPDINQCRSITVREAARLQSFPDDYYFEGPRTAQFVQIGNAVPPIMAKEIAKEIKKMLIKDKYSNK